MIQVQEGLYRLTYIENSGENTDVPLHTHPYYELHVACEGMFQFTVGGAVYLLPSGGACLIAPGMFHNRRSIKGGTGAAFGLQLLEGATPLDGEKPFWQVKNDREVAICAAGIQRELQGRRPGYRQAADAWATLLVLTLLREKQAGQELHLQMDSGDEARASRIDSYMADHMCRTPNAGELAALLHITPRQLERVMRRLYGMTFSRRLRLIRLSNARHLLLTTDLTMEQIALRCGFSGVAVFSAAFRAEVGDTPSRWRRSQKNREENPAV